jgi:hypothetical protein
MKLSEKLMGVVKDRMSLAKTIVEESGEASSAFALGLVAGIRAMENRLRPLVQEVRAFEKREAVVAAPEEDIVATLRANLRYFQNVASLQRVEGRSAYTEEKVIKELERIQRGEKLHFKL